MFISECNIDHHLCVLQTPSQVILNVQNHSAVVNQIILKLRGTIVTKVPIKSAYATSY